MNTLTILSFVRAHNPGLTPGVGAFLGAYLDGVYERAADARCRFVSVKSFFLHRKSTVVVMQAPSSVPHPLGSASAWLALMTSVERVTILAAEVYEQGRE